MLASSVTATVRLLSKSLKSQRLDYYVVIIIQLKMERLTNNRPVCESYYTVSREYHYIPHPNPSSPFVGPPSAPQNLVYNINQTTLTLEWNPPADAGGRTDLTYRVMCRRCSWEPEECVPCGGNVAYTPLQSGLTQNYITISELLPHANYTFEVEAVNGVSEMSRTQRLFASVSIATSQAGKSLDFIYFFVMWGLVLQD